MSVYRPTTRDFLYCSEQNREHVEREFFARVFLPNNTVKTTYAHRLDEVNRLVLPHIANLGVANPKIIDVGASSGVSTVEWYDYLVSNGITCEMIATDLMITAVAVSISPGFSLLKSKTGVLLHFDLFGRGCPPNRNGLHLNGVAQFAATALIWSASHLGLTCTEPVSLLSRSFINRPRLTALEDDIVGGNRPDFVNAFDVLRAANILNFAYFPEHTIRRMICNLKQRLKDGGILIVCRTDKSEVTNGTLFRLKQGTLSVIDRIGKGSEIEALITEQNHATVALRQEEAAKFVG